MDRKSSKIMCAISYDGSNYGGFQVQNNAVTVQQKIEEALRAIAKRPTRVYASGRTDAGVHAKGQVIHFETTVQIPEDRWPLALNSKLPDDIVALNARRVSDDFHARFDAREKTYRYRIWNRRTPNVFLRKYAWHIPVPLDLEAMREGAKHLVGEHDFTSFCSAKTEIEDKTRRLYEISIDEESAAGEIWISMRGNGFLYNMARIIVGTLVDVGKANCPPDRVLQILRQKDRRQAGATAPPQGLYLWAVKYDQY